MTDDEPGEIRQSLQGAREVFGSLVRCYQLTITGRLFMNRNGLIKSGWWLAMLLMTLSSMSARAKEPVRLALVSADEGVRLSADLLTAEFSRDAGITLLERDQVERIYRELAAGGQDFLKLGQVLGADGLLLLDSVEEGAAPTPPTGPIPFATPTPPKTYALNARLVAVKPGVVLAAERFTVERDMIPAWASAYVRRLQPLLPKLVVLAKDAIPVSVVNLRSAVSSSEAPELEQQLQTLVVQRLSREPQLFVLERQKLQQATEEKGLLKDETAFWNGAWLLEGVVDQNSYSKHTITLNVRLTPAKGGPPAQFEISGSRTNLTEVINALAVRVVAALKINSPVKEWNAVDEAAQFFEEAKWALNWGVYKQAQTAADAAWALGKRDLTCALLRGKSYVASVNADLTPYTTLGSHFSAGFNADGVPVSKPPSEAFIQASIAQELAEHPWGAFYKRGAKDRHGGVVIDYAFATGLPSPRNIEHAKRTLELYLEFCRTSPDGHPKVLSRGAGWNDWHNSDWYQLGIDELAAASRVLQNFYFTPQLDASVATQLAELRALVRAVATIIAESPTVRDSYFVGGRIATHDELEHSMTERPTIFSCMAEWGCFWQEKPEDTLELYRKLLASPVFCYIHGVFWNRGPLQPRLVAWNKNDRARLPILWDNFMSELDNSTNLLWQMEAKALAKTDAADEALGQKARQEWWSLVRSNRAELVGNNVELLYLGWRFEANAETEAMNREYWDKTIPALKTKAVFEEQKKFLSEYQPYEFQTFVKVFREKGYSQQQALELLPLIAAYKSNLLARAQQGERGQKFLFEANARSVDVHLQRHVEAIAHPKTPPPPQQLTPPVMTATSAPTRPAKRLEAQAGFSDVMTNIIPIQKFLEIPLAGLDQDSLTSVQITAHHMVADKLLLDLKLEQVIYYGDAHGKRTGMRYATIPAIALLDTKTEGWQVIECEETDTLQQNLFYHHTTLWRDRVFTSQAGKVQKYNSTKKVWVELELPDVGNCALFVINDRLYGATHNLIVEILEGGDSMRILASNRRQPPASVLDRETLGANGFVRGTPALFGDSSGNLGVITAKKVFSWDGNDWSEICTLPQTPGIPRISTEGFLLIGDGWNMGAGIWRYAVGGNKVDYWLGPEQDANRQTVNLESLPRSKALWKLPQELMASSLAAATSRGDDLLVLRDHARAENIVNEKEHVIVGTKIHPQDGYHASLVYFSSNYALPQKLYLRFDDVGAVLPVSGQETRGPMPTGSSGAWLSVGNGRLYFGREGFAVSSAGGRMGDLPRTGVWVVSLEQLDQEIERQKTGQDARQAEIDAANRKTSQRLLKNFDRNRDGQIDGEEKESAFTDENFVASQLDQIDTNQNGWIDAGELKYFDANKNDALDASEQAGIEHAQHLLATRLLKKSDANGDGLLDRREFDDFLRATLAPSARVMMGNPFPDDNNDSWIDVEEMRTFCEQQTKRGVQNRRSSGRPFTPQMPPGAAPVVNANQRFKTLVEEFWQNGGTNMVSRPFGIPDRAIPVQPK